MGFFSVGVAVSAFFFQISPENGTDVFRCHNQRDSAKCWMLPWLACVSLLVCGSYWTLISLWISSCPFDENIREKFQHSILG
jgi:hypothetical protein